MSARLSGWVDRQTRQHRSLFDYPETHLNHPTEKNLQRSSLIDVFKVLSHRLGGNPAAPPWEPLLGLLLCTAPLFLVTVRGWSNTILILGALFCMIFFSRSVRRHRKIGHPPSPEVAFLTVVMVTTLASPVLAVTISSGLRGSLYLPQFDSPARLCMAIPIFFFALRTKLNAAKFLQFAIPAALILTLGQQYLITQPMHWGPTRMATYFADPLVFGYVSMTFGLICAVSINLLEKDSNSILGFKLFGAFVGLYLSIQSGSRTGWMAIPIVLGIWAYQHSGNGGNGGNKRTQVFFVMALSCLIAALVYVTSSTFSHRVDLVANEIETYPWTGIAPETAVGSRITFLRIAWDMFFQNPWSGIGDTRFEQFPLPPQVLGYASPTTLATAFRSGFHNEVVTNAIRSGLMGLLSSAALFVVPFAIFARRLKSDAAFGKAKANAVIGITFVVCMFVSSLSTEILDLKYTASFYALMIALLCGSTLAHHEHD